MCVGGCAWWLLPEGAGSAADWPKPAHTFPFRSGWASSLGRYAVSSFLLRRCERAWSHQGATEAGRQPSKVHTRKVGDITTSSQHVHGRSHAQHPARCIICSTDLSPDDDGDFISSPRTRCSRLMDKDSVPASYGCP